MTQPKANLGEEKYLTVLMHNTLLVIPTVPGSSRQITLDISREALLELGEEGGTMQGHLKAAVICYQNIIRPLRKSHLD